MSASVWLEKVDGYLGGDAEKWANRTPGIRDILVGNTPDQRMDTDVATFKNLFLAHFQTEMEAPLENSIAQITSLCQAPTESLLSYHRHTPPKFQFFGFFH